MFKYFMNLLYYEPGDESIILDSTWVDPVGVAPLSGMVNTPQLYLPSPNPALDMVSITYYLPNAADTRLYIYDVSGRLVQDVKMEMQASSGFHREDVAVYDFANGIYFCTLASEGKNLTKSFVVQH